MGPEESGPQKERRRPTDLAARTSMSGCAELENGASVGSSPHYVKESHLKSQRCTMAGVILAAGRSSRMGRPKSLLRHPPSGLTFAGHLIRAAHAAGLVPVFVVVREGEPDIAREAEHHGATLIVNPDPDRGQLSSLFAALPSVEAAGAEGMVVLPVDVPLVSPATITAVLNAAADPAALIARASHQGEHGHPVLFKRAVFDELRAADPSVGARAIVRADPRRVRDVEVDEPGVTVDIDTPADYFRVFGVTL
jgi:molybdenum cofactor cytidylyltransferase